MGDLLRRIVLGIPFLRRFVPWKHVTGEWEDRREYFFPFLPGCELKPGPAPDIGTIEGWHRVSAVRKERGDG